MADMLIGRDDIASRCGISLSAVNWHRRRGSLPAPVEKAGRRLLWSAAAIDAWWRARRPHSVAAHRNKAIAPRVVAAGREMSHHGGAQFLILLTAVQIQKLKRCAVGGRRTREDWADTLGKIISEALADA